MNAGPFDVLLDRYQNGEATTEELDEFDRQLRGDALKRRMLVERTLLEVQLRKFFGGLAPAAPRLPRQGGRRWRLVVFGLIAVALALALLAVLLRVAGGSGPRALVEAGVVRVNNGVSAIVPARTPFEVGGQVPAVLRLPDGAHAELDPGTRAILHGGLGDRGRRIELMHGGGKFVVATGQAPLHIETPAGVVVAKSAQLTVRFGKAANRADALTVAVSAGTALVEVDGQRQAVSAGEQRVFAAPAGQ
jgi:ferric-dicitrate binding protein FerR (iron transport regulator)